MQNAELERIMENAILDKSFAFSVRVVKLYKYLTEKKKEYILSKQILRAGTSIGANVTEAQRAQSKADFKAKMGIALKEAYEVDYWLKLFYETEYLTQKEFNSLYVQNDELIRLLISICKSSS